MTNCTLAPRPATEQQAQAKQPFAYIRTVCEEKPGDAVALEPGFVLAFTEDPARVVRTLAGEALYRELGDVTYDAATGRTYVAARAGVGSEELSALMSYATRTRPADRAKWPVHMHRADRHGICVIRMSN